MLQRNPESPAELPPTAEVLQSEVSQAIDRRFERYLKRRRIGMSIAKFAIFTGLLANAHSSLYLSDVRANMLESAETKPSILTTDLAIDPHNAYKDTVFMHGFNTYGARHLATALGDEYQAAFDGRIDALQYNNAVINADQIAETIHAEFSDTGITAADFVLYSQGGVIGAEAITKLISETDTRIENVTFASSPSSYDTLTQKSKDEIGMAKSLAWIPWIEYSTLFRLGAEAFFYRDDMKQNFANASNGIAIRYNNGDMTSNLFIGSQINKMAEGNVAGEIEKWGELRDTKHIPNINYLLIENDITVDNVKSVERICGAARKIGAQCTVLTVDTIHGDYYREHAQAQYAEAFEKLASITKPYTTREAARHALSLYGNYQGDWLSPVKLR